MTFDLEEVLHDLKAQKTKTSALRSSFDLLIDEMLEKKIESVDRDQERIFSELIQSNSIKQKYVIKQEYELVKNLCKVFVNTGTQTNFVEFGSRSSSVESSSL